MALAIYSPAPPARPFSDDKPVLLTSWWMTVFSAVIILLRLGGRYVRVERLFLEDRIAALVLIPLLLRMAFVHPILLHGTNNVLLDDDALRLSEAEIANRALASRLVLVSRIVQPAILWLLKLVTLEFFARLVGLTARKRYTILLHSMRGIIAATFIFVVISNLAECQPFAAYWQVTPDPGPQCRQAYVHLLVVTACNVFTDLLLVIFPVPIVVKSKIPLGRKTLLVLLFCLHLFTVVVAIYRVPEIMNENGYQATRTMWASGEVFMATFAANALTLGTFVRDTGVKKQKFKYRHQPPAVISATRAPRADKTVGWDDPDLDVEEGGGQSASVTATSRANAQHSRGGSGLKGSESLTSERESGERVARRSESMDSLIPRGRLTTSTPDGTRRVIKTTTIEVTVSAAEESSMDGGHGRGVNGLVLQPVGNVATASARGRARGTSILLQNLDPLPDTNVSQGERREM